MPAFSSATCGATDDDDSVADLGWFMAVPVRDGEISVRIVTFLSTSRRGLEGKVMARKKVSRNAPCPCGSGKKYKKCCWGKGFDWEEDEGGNLYQSTPISGDGRGPGRAAAEVHREVRPGTWAERPGVLRHAPPRTPGTHDGRGHEEAGIDPAFIYAFEKTGRLVTEENQHLLPETALDEWQAAIEEYEAKHRKKEAAVPHRHRGHVRPRRQDDHEDCGWRDPP